MFYLEGREALSHFRIERLITQINYIVPQVTDIYAEYIHFIDAEAPLTKQENEILESLLDYGQYSDQTEKQDPTGTFLLVAPRPGTVSPWSSKATDILHHCHLKSIRRIERGVAYYIENNEKMTWGDLKAIANILHDPMTETVFYNLDEAKCLFEGQKPKPLKIISLLENQKEALHILQDINEELGLSLSEEELKYLIKSFQTLNRDPTDVEIMMFAQLNTEQYRHKIFHAQWIIDDAFKSQSLFAMLKNTYDSHSRGMLSTFGDNTAIIKGVESSLFYADPITHHYQINQEPIYSVFNVETHNHPTAISPYSGAATCVGSEIRDESASGNGAQPKGGLVGFCTSNLEIPGFLQPWEIFYGRPKNLASALDIMLEAPFGCAQFGNEFGRPTILGFFRTFEHSISQTLARGYHKPIMLAGGVGTIRHKNIEKKPIEVGDVLIVFGGPAMRIGLGVDPSYFIATQSLNETFDFASVQRGNADMQRICQEVINTCSFFGKENPILALVDVGQGGLANALSKLVYQNNIGGHFELRAIPSADPSLSPLELWCNEAQERFIAVIKKENLPLFQSIAKRESCPYSIIGEMIESQKIECHDNLDNDNSMPVNLPTEILFGNVSRLRQKGSHTNIINNELKKELNLELLDIYDAALRVLTLPAVADKSFLINIQDRSVTGLVVRDPMVGPWQVPVADCAVMARDYQSYYGEALSLGERPILSLQNPKASAKMAVGEAITNIAAACIGVLSDVRLSVNWMGAVGFEEEGVGEESGEQSKEVSGERSRGESGEGIGLFDAVEALGLALCPELNITIALSKDSLTMQTVWEEDEEIKRVVSPLSPIVTAFAPVMDIRRTLTPFLQKEAGETQLIFIDLAEGHMRLGGSALAQVYNHLGNETPDLENPKLLKNFFTAIQQLNLEDKILAYHDRSDGGLFVTLCEMAFAGHCGIQIDITSLGDDPKKILFNEELGAVIQIHSEDSDAIILQLNEMGVNKCQVIGSIDESDEITFVHNEQVAFRGSRIELAKTWSQTSYHMQALRDNPRTAKKQYEMINDRSDPGLNVSLTFDMQEDIIKGNILKTNKDNKDNRDFIEVVERPKVAILREQGINGHQEMAAAFYAAGFLPIDMTMEDLSEKKQSLETVSGLAVSSGFSYGDALGAGQGWAKRILFNDNMRHQFEVFFKRRDTFTLGVSNGCQMLSALKDIIPGTEHWPRFIRNYSEAFECRLCLVEVEPSSSILFEGMAGSQIPIVVAHAEGRAEFEHEEAQEFVLKQHLVTLRYVDSRGRKTNIYPANPNGSPLGITGLTTIDGRVNIMMPNPERGFRSVQYSWHPKEWGEEGPWLRLFQNARKWVTTGATKYSD